VTRSARRVATQRNFGILSKQAAVHKFLRGDSEKYSAGTREARSVSITGIVENYFFQAS
jgi:hypothetical protein